MKGLITRILEQEGRDLKHPIYRLYVGALSTKSDHELARIFQQVGAKLVAGQVVARRERQAFDAARRRLMERGVLCTITHEDDL